MVDLVEKAKKIINDNLYLTLATTQNNMPWVSPVWYAVDKNYNFYFISENKSLHAQNIYKNANVAFSIFNSTEKPEDVNGLQINGTASEMALADIPHALMIVFSQSGAELLKTRFRDWGNPLTYTGLAAVRIYRIIPTHFYILDPEVTETDKRVEIKLI